MENKKGILDIDKYRWVWLGLSALFLIPGIIAMIYSTIIYKTPLQLGIDYTGGTMLQYTFDKEITKTDEGKIRTILNKIGIDNAIIQTSAPIEAKDNTKEAGEKAKYVVSLKTRYLETTSEHSEAADILSALKVIVE